MDLGVHLPLVDLTGEGLSLRRLTDAARAARDAGFAAVSGGPRPAPAGQGADRPGRAVGRPARIREIVTEAGFTGFRSAAETPFNRVLEVRP